MSERWKFQISIGVIFGVVSSMVWLLFELTDKTFTEAFMSYNFLFRVLAMVAVGIFLLGYLQWRQKQKAQK